VLVPKVSVSPSLPLADAALASVYLSQDVYFLGYPFGLSIEGGKANNGFPIPFAKKGIIAAFTEDEGGVPILIVDAINNHGFSGGPVLVMDHSAHLLKVVGVVSSYKVEEDNVMNGTSETKMSVRSNTGLLVAYFIKAALDVIHEHPIGAKIDDGKENRSQ